MFAFIDNYHELNVYPWIKRSCSFPSVITFHDLKYHKLIRVCAGDSKCLLTKISICKEIADCNSNMFGDV